MVFTEKLCKMGFPFLGGVVRFVVPMDMADIVKLDFRKLFCYQNFLSHPNGQDVEMWVG